MSDAQAGGPSMEDLAEAYGWAESGDPRLEAISITLVQPDDEWPLQVLAPREQLPGVMTVAEALKAEGDLVDFAWGSVLVQTDSIDGWAALIEPNGWAASMPEAVIRLAARGEAVNVFWNVNAVMSFSLARDGALVRTFDPLLYDDSDGPLPDEMGLPWGVGRPRASAFALMERLTHVRMTEAWLLERPRETFVVPIGD
jgi:hypothetical protein